MAGFARRRIGAIIGMVVAALVTSLPALSQSYPSGPVRVMVPFGAGGATDVMARVFAERLQQTLGQAFTVENRAGGGGQVAATAFARAPGDGYTLLFTTSGPLTIVPLMNGKETRKDLVPVAIVAVQPPWLVVNAASPFKSFGDVVKHARDNPGKLTFGSPGLGTESHLAAEAAAGSAGIKLVHVAYRSGAEVIAALLGRQIDLASLTTASVASPLKEGSLRAVGVSSPQRIAEFPDVPTFAELGHPGATMLPWWGFMAPPGTPQAIVARLTQELETASKDAAVRERLKATFVQIDFAGPQEFAKRLDGEAALYGNIIRAANIKIAP